MKRIVLLVAIVLPATLAIALEVWRRERPVVMPNAASKGRPDESQYDFDRVTVGRDIVTGPERVEMDTAPRPAEKRIETGRAEDCDPPASNLLSDAKGIGNAPSSSIILAMANSVAARRGWRTRFPVSEALAPSVESAMRSAFERFQAETTEVEVVRKPIVKTLAEEKFSAGHYEITPGYADVQNMSHEERRAVAAARRPSRGDQTVVTRSGAGGKVFVVRVDADEHPSLQLSYERFHASEEVFVQEVSLFVNPISKEMSHETFR